MRPTITSVAVRRAARLKMNFRDDEHFAAARRGRIVICRVEPKSTRILNLFKGFSDQTLDSVSG
jgi:hypothetical protein